MPGAAAVPRRRRVVFIDLARAVAVVLMVQGHAIDTLLAPGYRGGPGYDGWLFVRGLTSCTFLTLSGLAFSVTALHHWDDQIRWSRRVVRRVTRLAFFLGLGYLMRFPVGKVAHLRFATPQQWQGFFVVDILHLVAVSLLGLQALMWLVRSPRAFGMVTAALGAAVVAVGPLAWQVDWAGTLPPAIAAYLSPATGSLFPLFPWSGYILVGAAFGVIVEPWLGHDTLDHVARVLVTAGVVAIAGVWLFRLMFVAPYGDIDLRVSPGFFVLRLGAVTVLLGLLVVASAGWRGLHPLVQSLAEESLLVYAVHISILYGSRWNTGMQAMVGPSGPGVVVGWVALLVVASAVMAWAWNRLQRTHPGLAAVVRAATIGALVYPMLGRA